MISLFMHGGPSHVDLLDPKPELTRSTTAPSTAATSFTASSTGRTRSSSARPWKFAKRGQCGTEVSELLPATAGIVDDICVVRSMHTGHNGHEVSIRYFHGGIAGIAGRPTMGSWIVYGLGSPSQELPAYIGGRAAEAVGQKLKSLSRGQQVLCVTHLPQIAAFADQHFLIDKREADGRTKTKVTLLDDRARTHEVARMVSGAKVTDTSLQHAAQMIAASR